MNMILADFVYLNGVITSLRCTVIFLPASYSSGIFTKTFLYHCRFFPSFITCYKKLYPLPNFFEKLLACQLWQTKLQNRVWQQKGNQATDKAEDFQSRDALQITVWSVKLEPINVTFTPRANITTWLLCAVLEAKRIRFLTTMYWSRISPKVLAYYR